MIQRKHHTRGSEGFTSYTRKGSIYLEPPAPPKFKRITHPERLIGIMDPVKGVQFPLRGFVLLIRGNWLRWLIFRLFSPSPRRRRLLEHV